MLALCADKSKYREMKSLEQAERITGAIEVVGGIAGCIGGTLLGLAVGAVEAVKYSEARAYSAITRLDLVPAMEPMTIPALAGAVGLTAAGVIVAGSGFGHLRHAELIEIAHSDEAVQ